MLRKTITLLSLLLLASCQSVWHKEVEKTVKSSAASGRINQSDSNSKDLFNELD